VTDHLPNMIVREFAMECYEDVIALWSSLPGICVREVESREVIDRYLRRNPGLSFVAELDGRIVGGRDVGARWTVRLS